MVKIIVMFSLFLALDCQSQSQNPNTDPFMMVSIRGAAQHPRISGNSQEGLKGSKAQKQRFVEVDFHISTDDILITAHDDRTRGCGKVSQGRAALLQACALTNKLHMASLEQALALNFDMLMLDLKSAKGKQFERTITSAIHAIKAANAEDRVIVFVYGNDLKIIEKLKNSSIPFGYKGYPKKETRKQFYQRASEMGAQYICIRSKVVEPEDLRELQDQGITLIAWEAARESNVEHVRQLVKSGLGGLISSNNTLFSKAL